MAKTIRNTYTSHPSQKNVFFSSIPINNFTFSVSERHFKNLCLMSHRPFDQRPIFLKCEIIYEKHKPMKA